MTYQNTFTFVVNFWLIIYVSYEDAFLFKFIFQLIHFQSRIIMKINYCLSFELRNRTTIKSKKRVDAVFFTVIACSPGFRLAGRTAHSIRAPLGGGGETAPTLNPKISPELKKIATPNLAYLSGQQFHTFFFAKLGSRSLWVNRE